MKELSILAKQALFHGQQLGVSDNIHLDDFIFQFLINNPSFNTHEDAVKYYFNDGRKSARHLLAVLNSMGPRFHGSISMLEFASGYGCVTRHLSLVMPYINFTACDIHIEAVKFISEKLGQTSIISHQDPANFALSQKYDVIFSLSFFSHMPRKTWGRWISAHFQHLNPGGALIFTTHGLLSKKHLGNPEIPSDGFWFKPQSEQFDLDNSEYGLTLVTREFVEQEIYTQIKRPITRYEQGFWWEHQDLYIVLDGN